MANNLKDLSDLFLLRKNVTFLNHGSFGACPIPVFDAYQRWQRELELQPVQFFQRRGRELLADARATLAEYVGADADEIAFVVNASFGLNVVIRSIDLRPGDEVLTTDQEYGTLDRTWELVCERTGARYIHQSVKLPITTQEDVVDAIWSGVSARTKVLFLSHITSPTALILPIEELIRRAKDRGIITVIDGAHAPGQIPLDMKAIGADFYVGNCHKWMMTPKGSGFLYARREMHDLLVPLVGGRARNLNGTSRLVAEHQGQGTRDLAAFLSVPEAIKFMEENDWPAVRKRCHEDLRYARERFEAMTGLAHVVPDSPKWFSQMTIVPIPAPEGRETYLRLIEEYDIEIPITGWKGQRFLRISLQGYNSRRDVDKLFDATKEILELD